MYSPDLESSSEILIGRSDCRAVVRVQRGWSEESGYSSTPANMTPQDDSSSSVLDYFDLDSFTEETRQAGCSTQAKTIPTTTSATFRRQPSVDDYYGQTSYSTIPTPVDSLSYTPPSVSSVSSSMTMPPSLALQEEEFEEVDGDDEDEDNRVMVPTGNYFK